MDDQSIISSTDKTPKPKTKKKPDELERVYGCPLCDKKFLDKAGQLQHEQAKHRVGTLIDIFPTALTHDAQGHSQLTSHDDQANIDLIAFPNDDGGDGLLQSNLPTTTNETDLLVDVRDEESDTDESFLRIE